jgi:hypothetical protein
VSEHTESGHTGSGHTDGGAFSDGDAFSDGGAFSDGDDGSAEAPPLQRALDLFVFAPFGVALTVAEDLPALITKGRQRFETDVRNARVIGQFVVTHGQREVKARVGKLLHSDSEPTATGDRGAAADATPGRPGSGTSAPPAATPKPAPDPADGLIVDTALAGYDTLSASQVVRRLESLGPDELRAIHRHEASHRNRRTILNRAHQLLEGAAARGAAAPFPEELAPEPDRPSE